MAALTPALPRWSDQAEARSGATALPSDDTPKVSFSAQTPAAAHAERAFGRGDNEGLS
jgi:hypothetical protein